MKVYSTGDTITTNFNKHKRFSHVCSNLGIEDYCEKYGANIENICKEQGGPRKLNGSNTAKVVEEAMCQASAPLDKLNERRTWRDKRLAALAVHQANVET